MPKLKPAKPSTQDAWAPPGRSKPAGVLKAGEPRQRQTRGINTTQLRKVGALPIALVLSLLLSLGVGGPASAVSDHDRGRGHRALCASKAHG